VVSFVKIDRVKTVHYLEIEKRYVIFYMFLIFVFSSMQQYVFTEMCRVILNFGIIHEVKSYYSTT